MQALPGRTARARAPPAPPGAHAGRAARPPAPPAPPSPRPARRGSRAPTWCVCSQSITHCFMLLRRACQPLRGRCNVRGHVAEQEQSVDVFLTVLTAVASSPDPAFMRRRMISDRRVSRRAAPLHEAALRLLLLQALADVAQLTQQRLPHLVHLRGRSADIRRSWSLNMQPQGCSELSVYHIYQSAYAFVDIRPAPRFLEHRADAILSC